MLFLEQLFPSVNLPANGVQCAVDASLALKIVNKAYAVRQILKIIKGAAAFIVDHDELNLFRRVVNRQGQEQRLKQYALAGSRCAGDDAVGTMRFIGKIQNKNVALRLLSQKNL